VYVFVPLALVLPVVFALRTLTLTPALSAVVCLLATAALAAFAATASMDPGVVPRAGAPGCLPPPPPGARCVGGPADPSRGGGGGGVSTGSALPPLSPASGSPNGGATAAPGGAALQAASAWLSPEPTQSGQACAVGGTIHRWCPTCEIYRPPRAGHWCVLPVGRRVGQYYGARADVRSPRMQLYLWTVRLEMGPPLHVCGAFLLVYHPRIIESTSAHPYPDATTGELHRGAQLPLLRRFLALRRDAAGNWHAARHHYAVGHRVAPGHRSGSIAKGRPGSTGC
jgi:hypothetical protein